MDVAARYRPGSSEEVGGDWYDVVPLDGGGTAFVIGDVQGHDLAAAALMGQLRSVVRAYLLDRQPPTAVLAAANSFLHSLGSDRIATACIALADTATRLVTVASAGHACPALVPVEDPPQLLTLDVGPPLGAVPDAVYRERTMLVPPTAQLVLYTDGLIERRAQAYDVGEKQLLAGLHGHGDLPPQELADVVFAVAGVVRTDRPSSTGPSPAAQEAEDDTALLAVRWRIEPAESRVRDRELPVSRESAVIARWYVGDVLPAWGVEPGRVETAVLLTDELVSNAVRHAYRQIRLTVRVDPAGVTVEVFDDSHREPQLMPPDIRATSGRGLQLVDALASAWGVRSSAGDLGKTVWFTLALPEPPALTGAAPAG